MAAVRLWAVLDFRRRWPRLIAVALLVMLVSGTAAASFAGALRGASALDRLYEQTLGMDALIPANPGIDYDWRQFDSLPYVEAQGGISAFAGASAAGLDGTDWLTVPGHGSLFETLERPVVFEGRMFDPDTPDELIVDPTFARMQGLGVGDTLEVQLPTQKQAARAMEQLSEVADPDGPMVTWTIVGIGLSPWLGDEATAPEGKAAVSPATLIAHRAHLLGGVSLEEATVISIFRLQDPDRDVARLVADARRLTGRTDVDVWSIEQRFYGPARSGARFEARILGAFGLVALVAGAFLVGSSIARSALTAVGDLAPGPALGMTRRQVALAAALPTTVACLLGGVAGAIAAAVASRWFPLGTAAPTDPEPGFAIDWVVLGGVLAVTAVFAGGIALFAAWRGARQRGPRGAQASRLASAMASWSAPVPLTIGTRLALEPTHGGNAVPTRPAQVGAVAGALGIVAALVFGHGIDDALDQPRRFGQIQKVEIFTGWDGHDLAPVDELRGIVADLPYVDGVLDARQGNATADAGRVAMIVYSGNEGPKAMSPVVTEGHAPEGEDEVLLATRTAEALSAEVGSTVSVTGSADTRELDVVGLGFVPPGAHNGYAEGGWVTGRTYSDLFSGYHFRSLLVGSETLSGDELKRRLETDLDAEATGIEISFPNQADAVGQLKSVRRFPAALAAFLGLLAVGVVANAVLLAVRRRQGEIAVLRAIGMTGRQAAAAVMTQALVLVGIGLCFGVPLGLAAGRSLWRSVASYVPLEYVPPASAAAILWVSAAGIGVGLLLAVWPARRAAKAHLASILRAE